MIPTNVFQSLNEANILQILVFCMFLGIAWPSNPASGPNRWMASTPW